MTPRFIRKWLSRRQRHLDGLLNKPVSLSEETRARVVVLHVVKTTDTGRKSRWK